MYPGKGTVVLIRPAQTFYERIKFDPGRGSAFLAFAVPVIVGEIKNYFRDHGWAVKIPRKLQRQKMVVERAVERLTQSRRRSPTVSELAKETGVSQEEVYDSFEVRQYGSLLSLDAELQQNGQGDASTVLDHLGANDPRFDEAADRIDLSKTMVIIYLTQGKIYVSL